MSQSQQNNELKAANESNWQTICKTDDLVKNSGVCALLPNNEQAAIFLLEQSDEQQVFAISNFDPIGNANILSRGIVGSLEDEPVVASPLYKQHFSLVSGKCLQDDDKSVKTYPVKIIGDAVQICA